ncbi:MAG: hypothetical protein AB7F96_15530 [Beijerinckiaceae bacterium]
MPVRQVPARRFRQGNNRGITPIAFLVVGASLYSHPEKPSAADHVLSAASAGCGVFSAFQPRLLSSRIPLLAELTQFQIAFADDRELPAMGGQYGGAMTIAR